MHPQRRPSNLHERRSPVRSCERISRSLGLPNRKPLLVLDSRWDNADTPVAFIKLSRDLYTLSASLKRLIVPSGLRQAHIDLAASVRYWGDVVTHYKKWIALLESESDIDDLTEQTREITDARNRARSRVRRWRDLVTIDARRLGVGTTRVGQARRRAKAVQRQRLSFPAALGGRVLRDDSGA